MAHEPNLGDAVDADEIGLLQRAHGADDIVE